MCFDCTEALGIDPFGKTVKKRAPTKAKGKKEERGKITHYEERKGTTALGDLCIKVGAGRTPWVPAGQGQVVDGPPRS